MNHLPNNIRSICDGSRDMPEELRRGYLKWCAENDTPEKYAANRLITAEQSKQLKEFQKANSEGPGTEFKKLCEQLGITLPTCGACQVTLLQMNAAGVNGCCERREEFLSEIKERAQSIGWLDYVHAAANAVTSGLAFSLNPLDPIGSLYDEVVRRAAENT